MPEIPSGRRLPWRRRANKGFKKDGTVYKPFYNARSTGDSRYGSKDWRTIRERVLQAYPVCLVCLDANRMTPAIEVDHIEPHVEHEFYDEDNLWALCKSCHAKKSAHESNGVRSASRHDVDPRKFWIDKINKNK